MESLSENPEIEDDSDEGDESPVAPLDRPTDKGPSMADVLGVLPTSGSTGPLPPLFEGSEEFVEYSVRGRRSLQVAIAEVDIVAENMALVSKAITPRGDEMKTRLKQKAYRTVFSQGQASLSKIELGGLLFFGVGIMGILWLVSTLYV